MSLYVRLFTGFWSHRKTMRLRALLGDDAYWVPVRLWSYAAEHQHDGCFKDYSAQELAMLLGYNKDAQAMLQALHQAGFMVDGCIHDWDQHNGFHSKFSERAKKAANERWKKKEKNQKKEENTEKDTDTETSIANSIACGMLEASKAKGTLEELKAYAVSLGLPESDGSYLFDNWTDNGWTRNKVRIKDWKAAFRTWKAGGHLPSQKRSGFSPSSKRASEPPVLPKAPTREDYLNGRLK